MGLLLMNLDMSLGLNSNFASADEGVATITWWFNDDAVSTKVLVKVQGIYYRLC